MHNLSLKLKINLVLLLLMALSTWYFLYTIDQYEKVISEQIPIQSAQNMDLFAHKVEFNPFEDVKRGQYDNIARQSIRSLYRYMVACDAILLMAIIIASKSIKAQKAVG